MRYKDVDYRIYINKLRHNLGYSGYGIMYFRKGRSLKAKQILPDQQDTFETKEVAKIQLEMIVREYIDNYAGC